MELAVLQVLALCMQAKEKGHDCFFEYMPHTNYLDIRIYKNGWIKDEEPTMWIRINLDTNEEHKDTYYSVLSIESAIDLLTRGIKEEVND